LRFTIIIPCFNRPNDLREAIGSCLAQTFSEFELIVVDDCSDEPLEDICKEFADSRIKYYRNKTNRGVSHSRNIGIDLAAGDYITFLDSDDVYLPDRLKILDGYIRDASTAPSILFHRQYRIISRNGASAVAPSRMPFEGERLDEFVLIWGNFIQTNSFVIERQLAKRIKFDILCKRHEDTKFFLECWLASSSYMACTETLSIYHDFPLSSRLSKQPGSALLQPLLSWTAQNCSPKASAGFAAYASAEVPFFQSPIGVLTAIRQGFLAGVPIVRCALYLSRSIFGVGTIDGLISEMRSRLHRLREPATNNAGPGT
jgi:glycosyltransferase involved in cell wall biosynthesis